ncbi:MAG: helix-turn-helix transcriptional regulator [Eubacteriales bacterium]|nr:helix-turn-helix transcriptional regulator [Eubacteriales bacterium]
MTDTTIKTVAGTLRRLRKDAGYTQDRVSHLLKIQRATYCNYENGSRTPPLEIIIALAELYQVSVDYLVRGIDTVPCTGPFSKELLREADLLPAEFQREVLDYIRFKKLRLNSQPFPKY